jgi:DNA-binding NtrC family response regulator
MLGMLAAHSMKMRGVAANVEQMAESDISVLIQGESGTGKEVTARALHQLSPRQHGPFVVVDCGAIPATLFSAELFGHEAGAFTGADEARPGLLEEADGGTLFLDEVGELPLEQQPLLLGALERKAARRVGGQKEQTYDLRVVAATNRNLSEEVRAGRFREDLYYRLAVGRVNLPPLRERPEDIEVLARSFAAQEGVVVTPELLRLLQAYEWPGNVRELRNTIVRAAVSPTGLELEPRPEPERRSRWRRGKGLVPLSDARREAQSDFERAYLLEALELSGNNMSSAAELAGVSRPFFMKLARRHGLLARDRRED